MNQLFTGLSGLVGGIVVSFIAQYILSGVKAKIEFSEEQKKINHEVDKRIEVLKERVDLLMRKI